MESIVVNSWIFWLIAVLVAICIIGVSMIKYPPANIHKSASGIKKYYANKRKRYKEHASDHALAPSAKFIKELSWLLIITTIAFVTICYTCDFLNMQEHIKSIYTKIYHNFTSSYPLLTTLIGAFIALICHYLFVHTKVYVSPSAYSYIDMNNKRRLGWYVENRSLFDCVDIHVDAFVCVYCTEADDVQSYRIKLKRSDFSVLSGRWAASNDKSIGVSTYDFPEDVWDKKDNKYKFDFIELSVKSSHSLSHVTKVITRQYQEEDIYEGSMIGGASPHLRAFQNKNTCINTLKETMLNRFMYARKFTSWCLTGIIVMFILLIVFPDFSLLGMNSVLLVSLSLALVWFSISRFYHQFPILTEADDENKHYRANINEDFAQKEESVKVECPYLQKGE